MRDEPTVLLDVGGHHRWKEGLRRDAVRLILGHASDRHRIHLLPLNPVRHGTQSSTPAPTAALAVSRAGARSNSGSGAVVGVGRAARNRVANATPAKSTPAATRQPIWNPSKNAAWDISRTSSASVTTFDLGRGSFCSASARQQGENAADVE